MENEHIQVITSEPDSFKVYFQKIWQFRALIWVFAKRDLKVKYAQTWLGLGWTIFQPLTAFAIYTFFFGYILQWKTDGIDYPVYVLSGLVSWNFFSLVVLSGINGIGESSQLVKKIYFPKSIIPISKVLFALFELGIYFVLLFLLLLLYEQSISWKFIFTPFVVLFNVFLSLSVVFWVSAITNKKRDLFHLVPFLLNFGIWFSPVFFDDNILPKKIGFLLDLNPITNIVEFMRWCLFDFGEFKMIWFLNFMFVLLFFLLGMYVFSRKEKMLLDYL
jgi:lipopolysaccharide transport system permease protein